MFALLLAALACLLSLQAGLSVLLGGMASVLPNVFFSRRVFAGYRANNSQRMLMNIYAAEISKLLFTASIFMLAILLYESLQPLWLFAAYFLVHLFPALYLARMQKK
ncbi:MAG: ATP synthase subunit I [gamma proteobacterium symbiont of Bathyaustriella thionipta]|nr:ATP synthase subunit I [gamma proteobacterium symbiont of Bathyaustriella thionipta]